MAFFDRVRSLFGASETPTATPPSRPPGLGGLSVEQAIDTLLDGLLGLSEPDEILRRAGVSRPQLRALEGDDEIAGALETRFSAVVNTPWRLDPPTGRVSGFIYEELQPHAEEIIEAALRSVSYGYSVQELVYRKRSDGFVGLASAIEKPFEWFQPRRDGSLVYRRSMGGAPIVVDHVYKFLLTVRKPSYRQPQGEALLSRAYWPWFLRNAGWRFFARFLERHGAPLLVGKTPGDANAMAKRLAAAVASGAVAVGPEDQVAAIAPGNSGEAFATFEDRVNRRIQKLILGQTLTTEVGKSGGSFAAAKVQDEVRQDRRLADLRLVRGTMQRLVNALTWINFPGEVPPAFSWEDDADLSTDRAERDAKLVTAGVVKLTEQYLLARYDFEPGDFEVPEAATTPPQQPRDLQASATRFAAGDGRPRPARFTPDQEAVEDLGDETLERLGSPIDPAAIRRAIRLSSSPDELVERLSELLDQHPSADYRETMARALFAADVMGYAHADQQIEQD